MTLALALPSAAAAQDPSADQYTPTAPSGGGSEPVSPVPSSGGGGGGAPPADSGSSGGSGSADPADAGGTAPSGSSETAPVDPVNASASGEAKKQHKDDRTLDGLAATASAQRADAGAGATEGPATELLRSESGGGLGMGIMLWAVLGVTALWAIATVVRRRQDGNGHPA